MDTLNKAGFKGQNGKMPYLDAPEEAVMKAELFMSQKAKTDTVKIGLAPFATHKPKIWGIERFRELISLINKDHDVEFFLFGGGEQEIKQLEELQAYGSNLHLVAGIMNLSEEIALIKKLDLMISMDSSNMHLAALSGIPTVSIWGGTHPAFGFSALGQPAEYHIQTPASSLKCRPCSVYGGKPCIYAEPKCMEMVKAADVINTLKKFDLIKQKEKKVNVER